MARSNAIERSGCRWSLRTAMRGNDPTFFLEHRAIQDTASGRGVYPGDDYLIPFGVANIIRAGTRATIVAWGEMVHRAKSAVELMGADIEIIDLRTIIPWDTETVISSVKRTSRCMVLHEDTITWIWSRDRSNNHTTLLPIFGRSCGSHCST